MSSSIQPSSTRVGGRTVAQGADAEDRFVLGLVGSPVFGVGVVACGERRVVNDHGEGGLNAAEAGCWRKPAGPLYCMLAFTINAPADQKQKAAGGTIRETGVQVSLVMCRNRAGMRAHLPAH